MNDEERIKLMEASIEMFIIDIRTRKWLQKIKERESHGNFDKSDISDILKEIDEEVEEIVRRAREESEKVTL